MSAVFLIYLKQIPIKSKKSHKPKRPTLLQEMWKKKNESEFEQFVYLIFFMYTFKNLNHAIKGFSWIFLNKKLNKYYVSIYK
jgi:hypothetical protein